MMNVMAVWRDTEALLWRGAEGGREGALARPGRRPDGPAGRSEETLADRALAGRGCQVTRAEHSTPGAK